jgi:hypothetical protein
MTPSQDLAHRAIAAINRTNVLDQRDHNRLEFSQFFLLINLTLPVAASTFGLVMRLSI